MSVIKSVAALVMAFFMTIGTNFAPYFRVIKAGGYDKLQENWSETDEFKRDYCFEIEKQPGKDFVILNLTDIQLSELQPFNERGEITWNTITKLIDEQKPDLITVTGDNATSMLGYLKVIEFIDSFGIPWAPVMGNHDGQGTPGENWCALQFYEAKNCLFKIGPKDMGHGNYIINITENGKIIHSLFMMDTHSSTGDEGNINGKNCYDNLWENQIEWYKWAVKGIENVAGNKVQSSLFMHIPICEYKLVYVEDLYNKDEPEFVLKEEYVEGSMGELGEKVCCPDNNNGFFNVIKELDSTKDIIVGHDHYNTTSVMYDGVRLSYGVKTGAGSYHSEKYNGGLTLTVDSTGNTTTELHFIPYN